jgi:hypothetical protein
MKRTYGCTIILLSILFTVPFLSQAEILVTPDNAQINYYGRFDFSSPSTPKFNWSGSIIEAAFSGNSIGINLKDGQADYDIEIDGKIDTIIRTESNTSKYIISTKLSTGNHVIRIMQRSENHWGVATFGGFYLADGNQLLAAPQKPVRKIEFIGDSHTVGYGNESSSRTCGSIRSYTNTNRSFGPVVGKAFHSQYIVLGWSGRGMVRNYGDAAKKSSEPYPTSYGSILSSNSGNWDFTKWIPDLVVISLCTNDFSTTPYPDDTMFINGYHKFIATVLSNYSNTSILCVSSHAGRADTCIKRVVSEENSMAHNKIYYAEYPQNLTAEGCDWHPTVADDKLIADTLISVIMRKVGWDTLNQTTNVQSHNYPCKSPFAIKLVDSWNDKVEIEILSKDKLLDLEITDIQGRFVSKLITNQNHIVEWNTSGLRSGIYLIGNSYYGWKRAVLKRS